MMTNLFSPFDPSNFSIQMNWMMLMAPAMILTTKSKKPSKQMTMMMKMSIKVIKDMMEMMAKTPIKENAKITTTVFMAMTCLNMWSLIPSSFTTTAQISMNIPLAMLVWLSTTAFTSVMKTKKTLSHLVPTGTPPMLMPLMVMIELTSNMIRPITLSIRLTANMVAGHILISLTENFMMSGWNELVTTTPIMSMLMILEMGVALIQAYIFSILITLFSSENH